MNYDEEEIIFWVRVIKGRRITFKREDAITKLKLSGPHSAQLFNRVKQLIALLEHRRDWAHCVNALVPLPNIAKVDTYSRLVFSKLGHDFVLSFNTKKGLWCLAHLPPAAEEPPADDPSPLNPNSGGPDSGGSEGSNGGRNAPRRLSAPAPKPQTGDEYRPISEVPRRAVKRVSRDALLWTSWESICSSPRFRHTAFKLKAWMERAKEALRTFSEQAQKALLLALGWADGLGNFSETGPAHFVQDSRFGAVVEPQVVERAGRTFTVWTFSLYDRPNWECWLFGRLIEDEHIAV